MSIITFNEESFIKQIKTIISKTFTSDEWFNLFKKNELKIIDTSEQKLVQYPCIYAYVDNNNENEKYRDSSNNENFTNISLSIEIYTNNLKIKSDILIKQIAKQIKEVLRPVGLSCTQDIPLPYIEAGISRKRLRFSGIINNNTEIIYR